EFHAMIGRIFVSLGPEFSSTLCDTVDIGGACYDPSYDHGHCGWKACPELSASDASRCSATPSDTSRRFCPCRRFDDWASLHMDEYDGFSASASDVVASPKMPGLHVVRRSSSIMPIAEGAGRRERERDTESRQS
ncbi:unnamed protein product, partial [Prorocentrum cordatum]